MEGKPETIFVIAVLSAIFTIVSMALRLYVRTRISKNMASDDYVMLGALATFLVYLACQFGGWYYGTGRHRSELTDYQAQTALKYWFFCEVFYAPATSLLKVSIGLFFLRIAVQKIHIWLTIAFVVGSAIFGTFYMFLIIFQCQPISFWWNLDAAATGKCLSASVFTGCGYTISVLNSAADIFFAALPAFIVWHTTMKRKHQALVCVLLGLASIACIATLVRIKYVHTLRHYKGDFLYNTFEVAVLSTIEVALGIGAANCATLRPLFQKALEGSR
ncbi:hypothetical protein K461DRAFT_215976, partial [Myriangium duriaei CBS 260.36]